MVNFYWFLCQHEVPPTNLREPWQDFSGLIMWFSFPSSGSKVLMIFWLCVYFWWKAALMNLSKFLFHKHKYLRYLQNKWQSHSCGTDILLSTLKGGLEVVLTIFYWFFFWWPLPFCSTKNVLQLLYIVAHEIIVPYSVSEYTYGPWKVSGACSLLMS